MKSIDCNDVCSRYERIVQQLEDQSLKSHQKLASNPQQTLKLLSFLRALKLMWRQTVVGRNTSLTTVNELSPCDSARSNSKIYCIIDNTRTFASKLKNNGRLRKEASEYQVFSRCLHHNTADYGVTGVNNKVKFLFQQLSRFRNGTFNNTTYIRAQVFRDQFSH